MNEEFYWFWLGSIPGIGNTRILQLLQIFGNAKNIYDASDNMLKMTNILTQKDIENINETRRNSEIYIEYLNMKKNNIKIIPITADEYPSRLKNIYNMPFCLYLKGNLPDENKPCVAIVGSRGCSDYGRATAYQTGYELAQNGVNVISGMARGIDGVAHRGAIDANGYTMGVLACGVDICYPPDNIEIYDKMSRTGGIISEFLPGTKPLSNHFPMRNRIISGLSDIILVVEARKKSGSLITVDMALEQNKTVMAVPGRINDSLSEGCNHLIKLGAEVFTGTRDVIDLLGMGAFFEPEQNKKNINLLASEEEMLYSNLDLTPKSLNNILEETGMEMSKAAGILLGLEVKGIVKEVSRGYYVRTS